MQHSFSNCGNPAKPHSRINPGSSMDGIVNTTVKVSLYCAVLSEVLFALEYFQTLVAPSPPFFAPSYKVRTENKMVKLKHGCSYTQKYQ